jgi:AhpD family alkylhydroperoxidase
LFFFSLLTFGSHKTHHGKQAIALENAAMQECGHCSKLHTAVADRRRSIPDLLDSALRAAETGHRIETARGAVSEAASRVLGLTLHAMDRCVPPGLFF